MVSQAKLRRMRDAPQRSDEKNLDGTHHYPVTPEGFAGRAFTFDESKGGYLPPDTDFLPAESDPNATRERPAGDNRLAEAAIAGAALLAARQQKAAQEHRAEAARNPNTPEARYHLSEEQRHLSAQVSYENQQRAIRSGAPAPMVTPTPEYIAALVGGPAPQSGGYAGTSASPVQSAGTETERAAAQARLDTMKRENPEMVASMGESAIYIPPAYEDYTERPFYSSAEAAGDPAETPFTFAAMGSESLPYGLQEGDHTYGSAANQELATAAHMEEMRSLGDAELARRRFIKLQGIIAQLRAKGLPTYQVEQQAGWALQREMRAEGLASQAQRIEDAQRWIGREDAGYEAAMRAQNAAAQETPAQDFNATATPDGQAQPQTNPDQQPAPHEPQQTASRDTYSPLQAGVVAAAAVVGARRAERYLNAADQYDGRHYQPQGEAPAYAQDADAAAQLSPGLMQPAPVPPGEAPRPMAQARTAPGSDSARAPAGNAGGAPEAYATAADEYDGRKYVSADFQAAEAEGESAPVPPTGRGVDSAAREARVRERHPERAQYQEEVAQDERGMAPENAAAMEMMHAPQTPDAPDADTQPEPGGPIDLASRGVVQPSALPSYVSAQGGEGGVTHYVFNTPPAAVALGYDSAIPLGSDEGGGVGERAWALASEVEAAIANADQSNAPEPHMANSMIDQMPERVPDMDMKVLSKPLSAEEQVIAFQTAEMSQIQDLRDEVIKNEVRPQDPTPKFEELGRLAAEPKRDNKPLEPKTPEPE